MKKYENPPVQEVMVKIKFHSDKNWPILIPGQFYEKSKELFPIIEYSSDEKQPLPIFFSKNKDFSVKVPNKSISFKFIKPYKSWSNCKDVMNICLSHLKDIVRVENIVEVTIQYSNRIEIEKTWLSSNQIFNLSLSIPDDLKERIGSLINGFVVSSDICQDSFLVVIQNSEPDEEKNVAYTFNITSIVQKKKDGFIKLEELFTQLDSMHEGIEEVFNLILTEKAKQTFSEIIDE